MAGQGGLGARFVQHRFPKPSECKNINDCSGKTFPDTPASPPGIQGSYYPGTVRPGSLHDYHGSLELTPFLSSEQMSMVRAPSFWHITTCDFAPARRPSTVGICKIHLFSHLHKSDKMYAPLHTDNPPHALTACTWP